MTGPSPENIFSDLGIPQFGSESSVNQLSIQVNQFESPKGPPAMGETVAVTPRRSFKGSEDRDFLYRTADGIGTNIHPDTFEAAEYLADVHGATIGRYVRARVSRTDGGSPEDTAQEALLGLMSGYQHKPPNMEDGKHGLMRLMYGILSHKVSDTHRRSHRHRKEALCDEMPRDQASTARSVEDGVLAGMSAEECLREILPIFTDQQQDVVREMLVNPEASAEELAAKIGTTAGAVRVSKHRIRQRAARVLQEKDQEAGLLSTDLGRYGAITSPSSPATPRTKKTTPGKLSSRSNPEPIAAFIDEQADQSQPEIQEDEAASYQRPVVEIVPPVRVIDLQDSILEKLLQLRLEGNTTIKAHIPAYIGQWATAARDLTQYRDLQLTDDQKTAALIVLQHENQRTDFEAYLAEILGSNQVTISSPEQASEQLKHWHFNYIAMAGVISPETLALAQERSRFLLHLLDIRPKEEEAGMIVAPSYQSTMGRLVWDVHDKTDTDHYLRELAFGNGILRESQVAGAARAGKGPTLARINRGYDSFEHLKEELGYTIS